MPISVKIEGLDDAKATVQALPDAFKDQVRESLDIGSAIILTEAARRVPVRTGKLKSSLSRSVRGDGQEAIVSAKDFKAHFIEFGTNDTPAQPFLYPAFRQGAKYVRASMRNWAEAAGTQARFKTRRRKAKAAPVWSGGGG